MTVEQYSTIQRCLGALEGVGAALEGNVANFYYDTLEVLSNGIEEMKKKASNDG